MSLKRLSSPFILLLLVSSLILQGCGGIVVGLAMTAGATAGGMALEERGIEQSAIDKKTLLSVIDELGFLGDERFTDVTVDVLEGQVYLTGIVKSRQDRVDATAAAWKVDAVDNVYTELVIREERNYLDLSHDKSIEGRLATALTFDETVLALNFASSVVNGTVYLFGIAQNQTEANKVIAHAKNLAYVRRVVSFIRLKDSPERIEWLSKQNPA